jgi:catechol 2,3-dioxygenase
MSQRYLSQIAHVALYTPKLDESYRYYHDVLGMEETHRDGSSVYLRAWGDLFHHSLKLTEYEHAGLDHAGWRAEGPEELEELATRLETAGVGEGWVDDEVGHGRAYRYRGPGGHLHEIFWDVTWHEPAEPSVSPSRPTPFEPRGAYVRRLDHVTLNTDGPQRDREFYCDNLGYRYREGTVLDNGLHVANFISTTAMSHDMGLVMDPDPPRDQGRLSHVAFWLDSREDVLRAADVYRDAGIEIEFGPGKHGIGENFFLYALEPGGNRVELYSGGYMIYAPDWGPYEWGPAQFPNSYWQSQSPETLAHGTPAPERRAETENFVEGAAG